MAENTAIEWADITWNCVTGCTKISKGCQLCYAERETFRLQRMGSPNYRQGFGQVVTHPHMLQRPLSYSKKKRLRIFVNSMSDTFHKDVPTGFIQLMFATMRQCHWHDFLVLTKRTDRMVELAGGGDRPQFLGGWPPNVWAGVSVEDYTRVGRIADLRKVPAAVRFVSAEPLIDTLHHPDLSGIHWLIAGGESGWGDRRRMDPRWAEELLADCRQHGTAFFMKQMGGLPNNKGGALEDLPEQLRIREFPAGI